MTAVLAPPWIELCITRDGTGAVSVSAHGANDTRVEPRPLGIDFGRLVQFAQSVATLAQNHAKPVQGKLAEEARAIHGAVFRDKIANRCTELQASAKQPLLVRFVVTDPDLQKVPWEALCAPEEGLGYLGTSPKYLPVRAVSSGESWQRREPSGALHVLAISPNDTSSSQHWKSAFQDRIDSGEVKWLEPLVGSDARVKSVLTRIRDQNPLHVIHYRGHGGLDKDKNPRLQMADDGEEQWLSVEVLAQELASKSISLVVLESCDGAQPSVFASAAEILARNNVTAVLAHSWRVYADHARTLSTEFYKALCASGDYVGNAAWAANVARRMVLADNDNSVCALSSVLYLRGNDARIGAFKKQVGHGSAGTSRATDPLQEDLQRRAEVMGKLLQPKDDLCKKLANTLGTAINPSTVVHGLLNSHAAKVATTLADLDASKDIDDSERHVARKLLWEALPLAIDLREVLSLVKKSLDEGRTSIELPLRTETLAEVILAGVDGRACSLIQGTPYPQGSARIPMPSTMHAPFFNVQQHGVHTIVKHLLDERNPGPDMFRHYRGIPMQTEDEIEEARALVDEVLADLSRRDNPARMPHYLLFIDQVLGKDSSVDLDQLWADSCQVFAAKLPHLRLFRLRGGPKEFIKELKVVVQLQKPLGNR